MNDIEELLLELSQTYEGLDMLSSTDKNRKNIIQRMSAIVAERKLQEMNSIVGAHIDTYKQRIGPEAQPLSGHLDNVPKMEGIVDDWVKKQQK